jgi:hypothetical protein
MPPQLLGRLLDGIPKTAGTERDKQVWLDSPFAAQMSRNVLEMLWSAFNGILEAKNWDDYLARRGAFEQLEQMLYVVENPEISVDEASSPEEVKHAQTRIQETINATRRD